MACSGLGPKSEESEVGDSTVTNRSIAWQAPDDKETNWFKLTAWNQHSKQLSELPNGTPTIAVGRVSTSEKGEKQYLNYAVDQILYLPKGTKSAPKKAADPEKGQVAAAAIGSINFSLSSANIRGVAMRGQCPPKCTYVECLAPPGEVIFNTFRGNFM